MKKIILILVTLFISACARLDLPPPEMSVREYSSEIVVDDQLLDQEFEAGLESMIDYLSKNPQKTLKTGPHSMSYISYATFLRNILATFRMYGKQETLNYIKSNALILEVYGKKKWGEILLTSYYSPLIRASRKATNQFSCPIRTLPDNAVEISIKDFANENFGDLKTTRTKIFAKLISREEKVPLITPLPSRKEFDNAPFDSSEFGNVLAWIDPLDSFFLHIQGSGTLEFEDGTRKNVGYAGQNGMKYVSIGKLLTDVIPMEEMSLQTIEEHLRTLDQNQMNSILHQNPSYVFFRELESPPLTTSNTYVLPKRTIAVDPSYFSLGLIGLLFKPKVDEQGNIIDEELTSSFIFTQDTGGAIKGPGRADLFWGEGESAKKVAGRMKHPAKLYFLWPKNNLSLAEQ